MCIYIVIKIIIIIPPTTYTQHHLVSNLAELVLRVLENDDNIGMYFHSFSNAQIYKYS